MLALGSGTRQKTIVDRPVESVDLVPTIGALLGFDARFSQGKPIPDARKEILFGVDVIRFGLHLTLRGGREAVVRLGTASVRNVVLATCMVVAGSLVIQRIIEIDV